MHSNAQRWNEGKDDSGFKMPKSDFDLWIESQVLALDDIDLQLDEEHSLFELSSAGNNKALWDNIDLMRSQMEADKDLLDLQDIEIEFVAGATVSFTAGIVSWVLRGGALLSSLLSSVSLFKQFDPLAVVFTNDKKTGKRLNAEDQEQQDKVEAMFDKQK